jgi:hypothetical protein
MTTLLSLLDRHQFPFGQKVTTGTPQLDFLRHPAYLELLRVDDVKENPVIFYVSYQDLLCLWKEAAELMQCQHRRHILS